MDSETQNKKLLNSEKRTQNQKSPQRQFMSVAAKVTSNEKKNENSMSNTVKFEKKNEEIVVIQEKPEKQEKSERIEEKERL